MTLQLAFMMAIPGVGREHASQLISHSIPCVLLQNEILELISHTKRIQLHSPPFKPSFSFLLPILSITIYTIAPFGAQIWVTVQAEFRDFGHIHAVGFHLVNRI